MWIVYGFLIMDAYIHTYGYRYIKAYIRHIHIFSLQSMPCYAAHLSFSFPRPGQNLWFTYRSQKDLDGLLKSLHPQGIRESWLKAEIKKRYDDISRAIIQVCAYFWVSLGSGVLTFWLWMIHWDFSKFGWLCFKSVIWLSDWNLVTWAEVIF